MVIHRNREGAMPTTITTTGNPTSRRAPRLVAAAAICLALSACGSQTAPAPAPAPTAAAPTTSATYSPELCSAAAAYQTAVNSLVRIDAAAVGTDGVKAALQDVQTAAANLGTAARAQFGPQVAALETAVSALRGTVAGLSSQDSVSANLGKIATSVAAVEAAAKPIVDSVRAGCPAVPQAQLPS